MQIIKNTVLILIMAMAFGVSSTVAVAQEAGSSAVNASEIIAHIEKGVIEVSKSDFSAAQVHLKAARFASDKLAVTDASKKAHAVLLQGQIQAKKGDVAQATEELNKAIALYKAL